MHSLIPINNRRLAIQFALLIKVTVLIQQSVWLIVISALQLLLASVLTYLSTEFASEESPVCSRTLWTRAAVKGEKMSDLDLSNGKKEDSKWLSMLLCV